ncbi:MAG: HNH endonuclease [Planctomycetes bacterium]|nr:HNH endonuclease [Planctomycetota bacterium]
MYEGPITELKVQSVNKVLNYLVKEFGNSASSIVHSADVVTLFMLTSTVLKAYSLTSHAGAIKDFFNTFLLTVAETQSAQSEQDLPFWNYKTYRKTSADSKGSIDHRLRIMLVAFLKDHPDLPRKDLQRDFDYWQRLAIFEKAEGCCQGDCPPGTYVRFEDGQYHHVARWTDGGPTTVENGQFLCGPCHHNSHAGGTDE